MERRAGSEKLPGVLRYQEDGSYKKLGTASGTSFKKKVTKGKTYYVKVRAVKKNSKGKTVYGAYSDVKSVYVDW